jgi:hypothetical protein
VDNLLPYLNVITPYSFQAPVIIEGSQKGLQALASALNSALLSDEENPSSQKLVVAPNGQTYNIVVMRKEEMRDSLNQGGD